LSLDTAASSIIMKSETLIGDLKKLAERDVKEIKEKTE